MKCYDLIDYLNTPSNGEDEDILEGIDENVPRDFQRLLEESDGEFDTSADDVIRDLFPDICMNEVECSFKVKLEKGCIPLSK